MNYYYFSESILDRLLIATGWYADREKYQFYKDRSKLTWQSNWLKDFWQPYIERFIKPAKYFCYISNCEIIPDSATFSSNWDFVFGYDDARKLNHRYGFHAALMMSLQNAYCERMDWLFIEQDCFVYGLDGIIDWARNNIKDKIIIFGWEPYCFQPGWAEQSLMYVPFLAIPVVLYLMNRAMVHINNVGIPEMNWYNLFKDCFVAWPFGYGRLPVRDWSGEMFYKQQLSDEEIGKFLSR